MKKIIGVLRPFDLKQGFYVYENGKRIDEVYIATDEIPETVLKLCELYQIEEVDLAGIDTYVEKIAQKIKKEEILKYNKNNITILHI